MAEARDYPLFSQCGLNCGLCPMYHIGNQENSCPGCGGGPGAQNCKIRRCAKERGGYQYCYECSDFPCDILHEYVQSDSFMSHRNMISDLQRAQAMGIDAYAKELEAKMDILHILLDGYNDGRRKSFYCRALCLLPLERSQAVMVELEQAVGDEQLDIKARGKLANQLFQAAADELDISLKLRKQKKS